MSEMIAESLLEMMYFNALRECFASVYDMDFVRMLKPSAVREAWVGFDQGWVWSEQSHRELMSSLHNAIDNPGTTDDLMRVGYFLQFKVVEPISRRSSSAPRWYRMPYLRAKLSLRPAKGRTLSQHEMLLRLSKLPKAFVYYALPMIFSPDDAAKPVTLDSLVCVDVRSAPSGWVTASPHHILLQNKDDRVPLWCSDPVKGAGFNAGDLSRNRDLLPPPLTAKDLVGLIESARQETYRSMREERWYFRDGGWDRWLPESFTVMEFRKKRSAG